MSVSMKRLMEESAVKFGTSGARGLITDRPTGPVIYTAGFISIWSIGQIRLGRIPPLPLPEFAAEFAADCVSDACHRDRDYRSIAALSFSGRGAHGITREIPSIMVTGSPMIAMGSNSTGATGRF